MVIFNSKDSISNRVRIICSIFANYIMSKLLASNVNSISHSDITVIGFPDDSKSDSRRTGSSKGPDILRKVYNESQYFDGPGERIPILPMSGHLDKKVFDFGNVSRDDLYKIMHSISSLNKVPITLGGDHSLTSIVLKAISDSINKKVTLLYFDAHPDFISSKTNFHGSVLFDSFESIDFRKSTLVGIRAAEPEEIQNIKNNNLEVVNPLQILERGISTVGKSILSKCGTDQGVYLSIDLDCIDSVMAPGVSFPTPYGLMPIELLFLVKMICSNLRVVGLDIVELCPDYDINNNTASIGARLLMEAIASISIRR